MTLPYGERPAADLEVRKRCDVRRAIMRRAAAEHDEEHQEGKITARLAEQFLEAVEQNDKARVELIRQAIAEICGPQKQQVEHSGEVNCRVIIIGEDDGSEASGEEPLG